MTLPGVPAGRLVQLCRPRSPRLPLLVLSRSLSHSHLALSVPLAFRITPYSSSVSTRPCDLSVHSSFSHSVTLAFVIAIVGIVSYRVSTRLR